MESYIPIIVGYLIYYMNPLQIFIMICYFFNYKYYFIMEDKEKSQQIIAKPKCMLIPDDIVKYHGITQDYAKKKWN